jgi:hypothetical protein
MSRGWESKAVESAAAASSEQLAAKSLADAQPAAAGAKLQEAERKRLRQSLELQRERILSERTSSPHRRTALTNALADIEEKLAELGWTIHL